MIAAKSLTARIILPNAIGSHARHTPRPARDPVRQRGGRHERLPLCRGGSRAGTPTTLFATRYFTGAPSRTYDASPDGQLFLMIKAAGAELAPSMVVVLNWIEELKAKLPAK